MGAAQRDQAALLAAPSIHAGPQNAKRPPHTDEPGFGGGRALLARAFVGHQRGRGRPRSIRALSPSKGDQRTGERATARPAFKTYGPLASRRPALVFAGGTRAVHNAAMTRIGTPLGA